MNSCWATTTRTRRRIIVLATTVQKRRQLLYHHYCCGPHRHNTSGSINKNKFGGTTSSTVAAGHQCQIKKNAARSTAGGCAGAVQVPVVFRRFLASTKEQQQGDGDEQLDNIGGSNNGKEQQPRRDDNEEEQRQDAIGGYMSRILNARVYDVAVETELHRAENLSAHLNNTVLFKREDTQPVFSFKIRGAYNKMANLSREELDRGVVACSAGNHAQGVALSARMLDSRAVIVMPTATPEIKVNAVKQHGGPTVLVKLHGNNYDEAAAEAARLSAEDGLTFVHPFDDPAVIAGQGTVGMEILKQCVGRPLHSIFVCCGGGGLLAGIAAYVKRVRPEVRVIGVEAADAASMTAALRADERVTLDRVGLFADGAAVRTAGVETFRVCRELVDDMVTVNTDQICNAIKLAYNDARVVLEPAGALAVAGLKKYVQQQHDNLTNETMVAITSGANMDFDRLRFVSERADESERTLAVTLPEKPGSFRALYALVWPRNVTEFSYRYESEGDAHVLLSFQPNYNDSVDQDDFEAVREALSENGFPNLDLTDNELAKVHVRHLAGGRSVVASERLFRFEFPESPGALQRFLQSLDMTWNVSLFHYRNHGDDFGRVLVGIQVPERCDGNLRRFLQTLGYRYKEETDNPVYQTFLRHNNNSNSSVADR